MIPLYSYCPSKILKKIEKGADFCLRPEYILFPATIQIFKTFHTTYQRITVNLRKQCDPHLRRIHCPKLDFRASTALCRDVSAALHNIVWLSSIGFIWTIFKVLLFKPYPFFFRFWYINSLNRELPRLIEVGVSCFNHHCIGYDDT